MVTSLKNGNVMFMDITLVPGVLLLLSRLRYNGKTLDWFRIAMSSGMILLAYRAPCVACSLGGWNRPVSLLLAESLRD